MNHVVYISSRRIIFWFPSLENNIFQFLRLERSSRLFWAFVRVWEELMIPIRPSFVINDHDVHMAFVIRSISVSILWFKSVLLGHTNLLYVSQLSAVHISRYKTPVSFFSLLKPMTIKLLTFFSFLLSKFQRVYSRSC